MKLLTNAHQNTKTAKNGQFTDYLSAILHLAPYTLSNFNVCPAASKGCAMACLNTAGRGKMNSVQFARIRKTKLFFSNRTEFMNLLIKDIQALERKAIKLNKQAVIRLNGTSDIAWENIEAKDGLNIFELFHNVQFYDYSKRVVRFNPIELPKNYHLTFSASEINEVASKRLLKLGYNVAVVFKPSIPNIYWNTKVIPGDNHDFRFMEGYNGLIVGLTAKGRAKKDSSGFVKHA